MIYITPKEKIEEYHASPALSQSRLKALTYGLTAYKKQMEKEQTIYYEDEPEHFIIGSGVDTWLTQGGKEAFVEKYYISNLESKPSETMMSIVKAVFDTVTGNMGNNPAILPLSEYRDLIIESAKLHKWNSKYGDDALFNGVTKEGTNYWTELVLARGKQVISLEEFMIIKQITDSLLTNEHTYMFFTDASSYDLFFQVPLYFTLNYIQCKALLDIVGINKKDGHVEIVDLKTMSGRTVDFPDALRKRRYDIQIEWYRFGFDKVGSDTLFSLFPEYLGTETGDFEIGRPLFVVESTTEPGNPLVFTTTDGLLEIARSGRPTLHTEGISEQAFYIMRQKQILGIKDLLEMFEWYVSHDFSTDYDYSRYRRGCEIDWYGILPLGSTSYVEL